MSELPLPESNNALAVLWREQLGVGGEDTLRAKLRRAPGSLSRAVRKDAAHLAEMENLWANPKLRRQIDMARVHRAQTNLRNFLKAVDPRDRRMGRIIGTLAPLMFNLLIVFAAVVTWLAMTGRL